MNKQKLFLTAIGVFAIVGGSLAFKAKSVFGISYCYTIQVKGDNKGCSLQDGLTPSIGATDPTYFYTIKGAAACNAERECNEASRKFKEN